jgi:predicted nucleic acid-binding protein
MDQLMQEHQLRPRDALHLAAMHQCNCFNLVSLNADFDHMPYLHALRYSHAFHAPLWCG